VTSAQTSIHQPQMPGQTLWQRRHQAPGASGQRRRPMLQRPRRRRFFPLPGLRSRPRRSFRLLRLTRRHSRPPPLRPGPSSRPVRAAGARCCAHGAARRARRRLPLRLRSCGLSIPSWQTTPSCSRCKPPSRRPSSRPVTVAELRVAEMVAARCTARPDLDRQRRQRAAAGVEAGAPIGVGVGLTLHRRCPTTRGGGGNSLRSTLLTRPMARHQWAYPLTCGAAHPPEATAPLPLPPLCPLRRRAAVPPPRHLLCARGASCVSPAALSCPAWPAVLWVGLLWAGRVAWNVAHAAHTTRTPVAHVAQSEDVAHAWVGRSSCAATTLGRSPPPLVVWRALLLRRRSGAAVRAVGAVMRASAGVRVGVGGGALP
jgi:hypothetical protein